VPAVRQKLHLPPCPDFRDRLYVAVLYYQVLIRLDSIATFKQTRDTLLNVAAIYFSGDLQRQDKLDSISAAYAAVGMG